MLFAWALSGSISIVLRHHPIAYLDIISAEFDSTVYGSAFHLLILDPTLHVGSHSQEHLGLELLHRVNVLVLAGWEDTLLRQTGELEVRQGYSIFHRLSAEFILVSWAFPDEYVPCHVHCHYQLWLLQRIDRVVDRLDKHYGHLMRCEIIDIWVALGKHLLCVL